MNFKQQDFQRISTLDAMYLQKDDIVLVRSSNVPKYGDHIILVTGPVVKKEHGMRPQTDVYEGKPWVTETLDSVSGKEELIIALKLKGAAALQVRQMMDTHIINKVDSN